MNEIRLRVYHPGLDLLSDRTLRSLLKSVSVFCREIQRAEALELLDEFELSESHQDEIEGQLEAPIDHMESYYVNKIRKGSIELTLCFTPFAIFILQQTLGASLSEAWSRSDMNKKIVDYLSGKKRSEVIRRKVKFYKENERTFGEFSVEEVRFKRKKNGDLIVLVDLDTPNAIKDRIAKNKKITSVEEMIEELNKEIKQIESGKK